MSGSAAAKTRPSGESASRYVSLSYVPPAESVRFSHKTDLQRAFGVEKFDPVTEDIPEQRISLRADGLYIGSLKIVGEIETDDGVSLTSAPADDLVGAFAAEYQEVGDGTAANVVVETTRGMIIGTKPTRNGALITVMSKYGYASMFPSDVIVTGSSESLSDGLRRMQLGRFFCPNFLMVDFIPVYRMSTHRQEKGLEEQEMLQASCPVLRNITVSGDIVSEGNHVAFKTVKEGITYIIPLANNRKEETQRILEGSDRTVFMDLVFSNKHGVWAKNPRADNFLPASA